MTLPYGTPVRIDGVPTTTNISFLRNSKVPSGRDIGRIKILFNHPKPRRGEISSRQFLKADHFWITMSAVSILVSLPNPPIAIPASAKATTGTAVTNSYFIIAATGINSLSK